MGMQEQAIKCKISNALLTGSVKSLGYSQLLEFQEFWNMDGFSKISTGNEFYANIRHTINYISNIESILFTILKKPCTVLFTSYSLAWLSNISTCTWNTDKFDLKFSSEQWVGGVVRLSYKYRTKQKTCTTGGQMILLDENATKVSYTCKHNMVCSYTLSILICYFNKTNYLRNPHFLEKKTINSNDFHETHDLYH